MNGNRIGKNDACWCGSGRKFKHCHMHLGKPDRRLAADVAKAYRLSFRHRICLAPPDRLAECSATISAAHTIPRSHLEAIAREQHVYRIAFSPFGRAPSGFPFRPELIGVNAASVVNAFCAHHDNTLFAPVEKQSFVGSKKQCFLLHYRAVCRELFQKMAAAKSHEKRAAIFRDRMVKLDREKGLLSEGYEIGTKKGLDDIRGYKLALDTILQDERFDECRAYLLEFESLQDVMCTGAHFPECDFDGNDLPNRKKLGNVSGPAPHLMSFSSIGGSKSGFVVFAWSADSDETCRPFVESLQRVPEELVGDALVRFFFEFCENTYARPTWWEGLGELDRAALEIRMATGGSPFHTRHPACLMDDGKRMVRWRLIKRQVI